MHLIRNVLLFNLYLNKVTKHGVDDGKTEVARYLDEARIEDEYLDLLN